MIQYRRKKSKIHEVIKRQHRNRRLNEWQDSFRREYDPRYVSEYEDILAGLPILHIDGDRYVDDLVYDGEWWEETCEGNDWDYNKKLDIDGNEPGDEDYDPDSPMYSEEKIRDVQYDCANTLLEDDINTVDSVANGNKIKDIILKHFGDSEQVCHYCFDESWFHLYKEYGYMNYVEWVFSEELLESYAVERIAEYLCNGNEDLARKKIVACCEEITQYVQDNSFVDLD